MSSATGHASAVTVTTVSVIIPACNSGHSLALAITSALNQTLRPAEIFVINDGSKDNTADVAAGFGARIRYIEQENSGQGSARNRGLELASGEYIAFLDADDYWLDRFLERCVTFLEERDDVVAVSTGIIVRHVDGREIAGPASLAELRRINEPLVIDNFFDFWARHDHVRTGSNVIRRSVIQQAGHQRADLRISQDLEYWGYIATFGKWGYIPEPLWVGNSRTAALPVGWMESRRQRRKLCPTVESWEQRIAPRLKSEERDGFATVRGRVALNFAQTKIIVGKCAEALSIFRKYCTGASLNRMSLLMHLGSRLGGVGWPLVCLVIRAKEFYKDLKLRIRARNYPWTGHS